MDGRRADTTNTTGAVSVVVIVAAAAFGLAVGPSIRVRQ